MSAKEITRKAYACKCERCGHKWETKTDQLPVTCPNPKCKSPYWNMPRKKA